MKTDKQRLTQEGWTNLVQDLRDGTWHGMYRGQGGYWLGRDLLASLGNRRDTWYDDDDYQDALNILESIKITHKFALGFADWGNG